MPCYLGIIHYRQCDHRRLLNFQCTLGCQTVCPDASRELVLKTQFQYLCEACHGRQFMNHARVRRDAWNEEARRIKSGSDGTDADANSRQMQLLSWCRRGELLEWLLSSRRRTQVQEIENAVEWTQQYGHAVCDLLEMSRLDGEAQSVTPSLESPAREDEEQGVEEGRGGERDEADEGEDDDEDDDDEGEDDDEDDEYDDEGDDEDDRAARRRLAEQHLVFMRSRKPLCLEVLQDSTQTQQQLQEAQEEERQSILAS